MEEPISEHRYSDPKFILLTTCLCLSLFDILAGHKAKFMNLKKKKEENVSQWLKLQALSITWNFYFSAVWEIEINLFMSCLLQLKNRENFQYVK